MIGKVNLERALRATRDERNHEDRQVPNLLSSVRKLFETEWEREQEICERLQAGAVSSKLLSPKALAKENIFELEDIRELCLQYRLRFLSTKLFKPGFPAEAIAAIKATERVTGERIEAFMIAAPAEKFHLSDSNKDPLLFAPLSDGRFYLIHKWGDDMSPWRKYLNWPKRRLINLMLAILGISLALSLLVPNSFFTSMDLNYVNFYRMAFFIWNAAFLAGMVSYFWFSTNQKFSVHAWNSPNFN